MLFGICYHIFSTGLGRQLTFFQHGKKVIRPLAYTCREITGYETQLADQTRRSRGVEPGLPETNPAVGQSGVQTRKFKFHVQHPNHSATMPPPMALNYNIAVRLS